MKQMSLSVINLYGARAITAQASGTAANLASAINVGFRNMKGWAQSGSGEGTVAVHFQQHDTATASAAGWDLIAGASFASVGSANGVSQCHFIPTKQYIRAVVIPSGSITVSVGALAEYGYV